MVNRGRGSRGDGSCDCGGPVVYWRVTYRWYRVNFHVFLTRSTLGKQLRNIYRLLDVIKVRLVGGP